MKNWSLETISFLRKQPPRPTRLLIAGGALVLAATTCFPGCQPTPTTTQPSQTVSPFATKSSNSSSSVNNSHTQSAQEPVGFEPALPGYQFQFPRDDGSHPTYMTEWWYYTGHLQSAKGEHFGYQLTFFRNALTPEIKRQSGWGLRDVILAHLALTDQSGRHFYFTDRLARGSAGVAGATSISDKKVNEAAFEPKVWLYDWSLQFKPRDGGRQRIRAFGDMEAGDKKTTFGLALTQQPLKPPAIHGLNGVSQKSVGRGHASHYYSYTRLATTGEVRIGDRRFQVTGQSWFDHEFGSNQLEPNQVGWDWFSLQLSDGRELMLYQLRLKDGRLEPYSSGTLIEKDGTTRHLQLQDFSIEVLDTWQSPHSKANYPARWRLTVPTAKLELTVEPILADQELQTRRSTNITYWEGAVNVTGTSQDQPLRGVGYVELTGYAQRFNATF